MKVLKVALKIDSIIQGLLLLAFIVNAINGLITFKFEYFNIGQLYLMFFLGVWQVTSAVVLFISTRDHKRKSYLRLVLSYFFVWALILVPSGDLTFLPFGEYIGMNLIYIYFYCVPLVIGTYYFSITYKNMIRSHYFRRSFWDI